MDRQRHWNDVFTKRPAGDVSWFESLPATSMRLLEAAGLSIDTCVLDVGGGDSHLIDHLMARGLDCLAVLDVSGAALARARARLGPAASIPDLAGGRRGKRLVAQADGHLARPCGVPLSDRET